MGADQVGGQPVLEFDHLVSQLWVIGGGVCGSKIQEVVGETFFRGIVRIWTQVELEGSTCTLWQLDFNVNCLREYKD